MSILQKLLITTPRETAGTDTSNLYGYQISFAALVILELMEQNSKFITLMDYLDDVVILDDDVNPQQITFFQVKTRKTSEILFTSILSKKWLEYMNTNNNSFNGENVKSIFATNASVKINTKGSKDKKYIMFEDFKSRKISDVLKLSPKEKKLIQEIYDSLGTKNVNLDDLYLLKTALPIVEHDTFLKGKLTDFIYKVNPKLDGVAINTIYLELKNKLTSLNQNNYKPTLIDFDDLKHTKGFSKTDFNNIINQAKDALIPVDFNLIYTFARNILEYNFQDKNYQSLKERYRDFQISSFSNKESYDLIIGEIKKINISSKSNNELIDFIHNILMSNTIVNNLSFYNTYYEYIIIVYIYKSE